MSQWSQSQPGYQYPLQTGFFPQNQSFQQPVFPQGSPTGFPGQRPPFQQPQQTGFPGVIPALTSQQTGLLGDFQQQQRPPVPPVPPLPSQFRQQAPPPPPLPPSSNLLAVNQQNRLLNPSPNFGASGLVPQQTGFPSPGSGLQPLVPQATGFVDPRLQMMSSTFLPANLAAPYNLTGAPQLLQPQQQLGGLSLQQSFQQHNQEVKGTVAPRVPWTLSKAEKKSYDQIFRAWDTSNSGFIDGKTAIEVFGQSDLDRNDLARIWTLADVDNRGKLNIAEFHVAMGLIYRKLNGNEIPDELPAELVPPSHRDLDTSVNFVKNLLQNEPSRARSPSGLDTQVSRLPNRSLLSSSAPGAGGRQDATVYKHTDEEPAGGYYTPRSRHLDRSAVRASSERDSPVADLNDVKRQLESTARMLDHATEQSALRTAEDDALDREMSDLKWKVQRVQEDLEYASRGPRSFRSDEERRRLERELLELMHERVPAVEKKLAEREERRARQRRELDRERDRRNETFGRFSDRDRDRDRYGSSYAREGGSSRYASSYDKDRGRDRDYDHERSNEFDRNRPYRDRSRSWEHNYDRERQRSPHATTHSPSSPPPDVAPVPVVSKPSPAPAQTKSPAPNVKNMTPEERRAFIQAEAQRRTAERMAAMGLSSNSSSTPKPTLDTSTEDRLIREKREAEEKARAAEEAAAERTRQRDERLRTERGGGESTSGSPATPAQLGPVTIVTKVPPLKPRAPAPPPPRKPGTGVAARSFPGHLPPKISSSTTTPTPKAAPLLTSPTPPTIDPEEKELHAREQALLKQKEERIARMRRLEEEEREEEVQRQREEAARRAREVEEAARKAKQNRLERLKRMEEEEAEDAKREEEAQEAKRTRTPAPGPIVPPPVDIVPTVPPPPPVPPTSFASSLDRGKNNPFNRLMSGDASPAVTIPPPTNGGNNPFFRSQLTPAVASNSDRVSLSIPPVPRPPPPSKSPAPPAVKTSYHTAPGDSEDEWGEEKDESNDSSEDELHSSRDTRDQLARQLFSSILPPANILPRPQSAAAGSSATPKASTPTALSAPTPPPPPAAPTPPPLPSASSASTPAGDRSALLDAIQSGTRLRKTVTNDRSASASSGRVLGDVALQPHIDATPGLLPSEGPHSEKNIDPSRRSVDWYMGLAADQGTHSSQKPSLPSMGEEVEEQARKEVNGHAAPAPDILLAHAGEGQANPLEDIDLSTEYRVRTLYPYDGQRAEELSFGENLVITAHASKTGSDWWYGTLISSGKTGFFPKIYVQTIETVKARGLYDYPGNSPDELPFSEGDVISIVDRSDDDWYKAEKDGAIFIVPAAYLEVEDSRVSSKSTLMKLSFPFANVGATSEVPELWTQSPAHDTAFLRVSQGNTNDAEIESASDGTASDYHSFSDSDSEDDEATITEEERKLEREMRAAERQLVLEAAGIVVKKDTTRRPRSHPQYMVPSVLPKHRPAPAPPSAPTPSQKLHLDELQLPTQGLAHLDDAYERYESFKQNTSRLSISSAEQLPLRPLSRLSPSSGSFSLASTQSHESLSDKQRGKENVSASPSYGSRISQLLSRSRTPVLEKEARIVPTISAPIMNISSSGAGMLGAPIREDSPGFGLSWASLVDKSALDGLLDRERRRQEAIFELIATEGAYVRDLQLIVEIFLSSMMKILEPEVIATIFSNIEDILLTNTTFLSSLEERQRTCRLYIDTIGDILDRDMVDMICYKDYCVNQTIAVKVLKSVREKNPELAALLQRLREDPAARSLDISSYLLVPMQRITRYPLLVKQILQYTESDQDRDEIERALHTAEDILDTINEAIRDHEGHDRLDALSHDLWVGQGRLDLTAPTRYLGDRKLLREGPLNKAKSGRKLRALLCNDIFLLTDEHGKTLYRMVRYLTGDYSIPVCLARPRFSRFRYRRFT
ncbi:hypothetical protein F5148DRAFT_1248554 [Russula earlei]|uniref:Uncharacterized protein n=1 Tax=Russula earlei TaxID=71964 RepID=A0ACC0TU18_9AGAM|nr:hypothetical protein F5148DRAFT_1248554 [Russula earlei]